MVLPDGHVVEFDSPENLLKNDSGVFHQLLQNTSKRVGKD